MHTKVLLPHSRPDLLFLLKLFACNTDALVSDGVFTESFLLRRLKLRFGKPLLNVDSITDINIDRILNYAVISKLPVADIKRLVYSFFSYGADIGQYPIYTTLTEWDVFYNRIYKCYSPRTRKRYGTALAMYWSTEQEEFLLNINESIDRFLELTPSEITDIMNLGKLV